MSADLFGETPTPAKDKRAAARAQKIMDACPCQPEEWVRRIESGAPTGSYASAWVCGLRGHHDATVAWCEATTGIASVVIEAER